MFKLFYGTFTARDHLNSMHGTLKHFLVFVGNSYSPEKNFPVVFWVSSMKMNMI